MPETGSSLGAPRGGSAPLLQQIQGLGGHTDTAEERAIDTRVVAADLRLNRKSTTATETIDLLRSAAERGEEDIRGDWRGTAPQLAQVEGPCEACRQQVADRDRGVIEGWLAHTECAVENVQGASDRGDDRFGVATREGNGPPRRRTFRFTDTYCQGYTNVLTARQSGVSSEGDSW